MINIAPSKQEVIKLNSIINEFIKKIKIKDAKVILGGSGAKNTWLSGTTDVDIFIKFNYLKYKNNPNISKLLEKYLRKSFKKIALLHGSRDYFQINFKNYTFEIIPILDIRKASQAKNITDISPLHITWVRKNIKNLADEIRLVKQFCKANNIYGAESYIGGFSGYVLEILIIHYGSFKNLMKNAVNWRPYHVIDTMHYHKNAISTINKSKISPLILIDPVQKERNAAAALTFEKFNKFKQLCQSYLKNPSDKFFQQEIISIPSLKKKAKNNRLLIIEATPQDNKIDIAGAKLLKTFNFIKKQLIYNNFKIHYSYWQFNKKAAFYIITDKSLPKQIKHYGPLLKQEFHLKRFKQVWKNYKLYKENNHAYVKISRHYTKPEALIKDLFKTNNVKDNIKVIKSKSL